MSMIAYYFRLALRSLRRNPVLSALMMVAIGVGIGASITTLTVLKLLSADPLPQKSAVLYYPQLDPRGSASTKSGAANAEPPDQLSYIDAMYLLNAHRADRQAVMAAGNFALRPDPVNGRAVKGFFADARETSADFFAMFDVPFLYGSAWTAADDDARARVAVISKALNDKLFGGGNSIGRTLPAGRGQLRIVGVLRDWRPTPRFYDIESRSSFGDAEQVFVPFLTARELKLGLDGSINCWSNSADIDHLETADCGWLQFWVELDTPAKAHEYLDFIGAYSAEQHAKGRFERAPNVRLRSVMEWLDYKRVVPGDVRLQAWLALGFLAVCLVNTVGLLLAKFLRRAPEIGVRRALGASRRAVFLQFLTEAGLIGLAGGALGLLLALAGLWVVRQQPADYAELAHLDLAMFAATFAAAVVAALIAGALPAWRACQIPPALQLKAN